MQQGRGASQEVEGKELLMRVCSGVTFQMCARAARASPDFRRRSHQVRQAVLFRI
jgi:hypothetical protein